MQSVQTNDAPSPRVSTPQELDEARHAAEALRREHDQLAADYASLRRQCDARSAHVAVLLDSNHRRGVA
jgi:hypothetical protein